MILVLYSTKATRDCGDISSNGFPEFESGLEARREHPGGNVLGAQLFGCFFTRPLGVKGEIAITSPQDSFEYVT